MDEEFPDLKMTALAVLFQTKWNTGSKPNDFLVKEALTAFASSLSDDDIGYFYDPKSPLEICTNPGELVGKIANSRLPYGFQFDKGIEYLAAILKSVSDDYSRIGVVISDCFTQQSIDLMTDLLKDVDASFYFFNISKTHYQGVANIDISELHNQLMALGT